jgi:hypothetical protein
MMVSSAAGQKPGAGTALPEASRAPTRVVAS